MPVIRIGVGQHTFFENSGTVHENVDRTRGMRETILGGTIEKIGTDGMDRAAKGCGNIGSSAIGGELISAVEDDIGAFAEKRQSSRMADPAGRAGDQNPAA
jgi:hypothetical protein